MTYTTTRREDWLNDSLASKGFFVSGSPVTSRRFVTDALLSLRFVVHFPTYMQPPEDLSQHERRLWLPSHYQVMMGFLAIELATQRQVDQFEVTSSLDGLHRRLSDLFSTPIAIVAYTSENTPAGIPERFWVRDRNGAVQIEGLVRPAEYGRVINERRNPLERGEPQMKPINKTINDVFQRWTRAQLSGQLAINDLDALRSITSTAGNPVVLILELKRSGFDIRDWTPFLDDVPNYMLAKACARKHHDALDVTIHYNPALG